MIKTNPEMNREIVNILRVNTDNSAGLYAAQRIEELESLNSELRQSLDELWDIIADQQPCRCIPDGNIIHHFCDRCEKTSRALSVLLKSRR